MKILEKPAVMLDTPEKWDAATQAERLYHATYLQQQQDNGRTIELWHDGKWVEQPTKPLPAATFYIYRLKPEPEYIPMEPRELEGMMVWNPKWPHNFWRSVIGIHYESIYIAKCDYTRSPYDLMEEGWRYRKPGEHSEGKLCRKEVER